jgi:hypothetical protein
MLPLNANDAIRLNHKGPLMCAISGSGSQYNLLVYDFKKSMIANSSIGVGFVCGYTPETTDNFYDGNEATPPGVDVRKQVCMASSFFASSLLLCCQILFVDDQQVAWRLQCRNTEDSERLCFALALVRAHANVHRYEI